MKTQCPSSRITMRRRRSNSLSPNVSNLTPERRCSSCCASCCSLVLLYHYAPVCVDVLCIVVGGGRCVTKLSQCVHQWWQVCDAIVSGCTPVWQRCDAIVSGRTPLADVGGRCVTLLSQCVHHVWQVCTSGGRCVTQLSQCVHQVMAGV